MSQSLCDHHMCHIAGVVNFMENLSQKECNTPLKQYTCQIILTTRYITLIKQLESETIHFIAPPLRSLHFNCLEKGVIHTRTLKTSRSYQDIIQILKVHFKYPSDYPFGLNSHHPQYTIDNPFLLQDSLQNESYDDITILLTKSKRNILIGRILEIQT